MISFRVLIVKDELRANEQLSRLLFQIDGIKVHGPVD